MTDQNKLYGNYLGIVVANNDPLKKGRVKIFVPHLSPSVYKNWNATFKDKKFKFLGKNVDSPIDDIVDDLKDILPWADCASPLAGEVSSGRYNSSNRKSTISDSNDYDSSVPKDNFQPTKYSQNPDGTGEKPANILEKGDFALRMHLYRQVLQVQTKPMCMVRTTARLHIATKLKGLSQYHQWAHIYGCSL